MSKISIAGLDKADVLRALYNRAQTHALGLLHYTPEDMTKEQAQELLSHHSYFDYVKGRVMKVNLAEDEFDPFLYDRDNGTGAAEAALSSLILK